MTKLKIVLISGLFWLILALPLFVFAAGLVPCGGEGEPECNICHFAVLIDNIQDFILFSLALPIAVIAIIVSGIMLLTAAGDTTKIEKGKSVLSTVIIGLFIIFAAWLIVDTIIRALASGGQLFNSMPWHQFPSCGGGDGSYFPPDGYPH